MRRTASSTTSMASGHLPRTTHPLGLAQVQHLAVPDTTLNFPVVSTIHDAWTHSTMYPLHHLVGDNVALSVDPYSSSQIHSPSLSLYSRTEALGMKMMTSSNHLSCSRAPGGDHQTTFPVPTTHSHRCQSLSHLSRSHSADLPFRTLSHKIRILMMAMRPPIQARVRSGSRRAQAR